MLSTKAISTSEEVTKYLIYLINQCKKIISEEQEFDFVRKLGIFFLKANIGKVKISPNNNELKQLITCYMQKSPALVMFYDQYKQNGTIDYVILKYYLKHHWGINYLD